MKRRLSFRIRDELVSRIASGRIAPGSKLPPEPELAEEMGVSRATLREALRSLEDDGFVTRTSGAGTYATHRPRLRNNLDVNFGVTEAIRAAGMRPGTTQSAIHTQSATAEEANALDLSKGEAVVSLERVRTADGRPVVFSRDVIAATRLPATELAGMPLDGSLYEILERHGQPVAHGIVSVEPERADKVLAKRLGVKAGELLVFLRQIDYGTEGEPLLLSEEHHVAEAFEFSVVRRGPGEEIGMNVGKAMRMKRVVDDAGVSVICALDHGMTSPVFLEPLADITTRARETVAGGANVIMMSKGMIRLANEAFSPTTSLAMLLSASADPGGDRPQIVQIGEVEEALVLGADAVVLFTALGGDTEAGMLDILSAVGRECETLGMPFIAEAEFPTTYATVEALKQQYGFEYLRRNVRLCAELGADIVKTNWPGDQDSFAKCVEAANGIPVVLAGGSRLEDGELLTRMEQAIEAGAIGCSVGRNIFMHANPEAITRALSRVIREKWSADKALDALREETV